MGKLNQVLAVEKGMKTKTYSNITAANKMLQKNDLFLGISREYTPKDDEGEQLPSEISKPQLKVSDMISATMDELRPYWDLTMTKETANTQAKASIIVNNQTLASDVPVTMLLFLEKQLVDLRTLVTNIPTLNPGFDWEQDATVEGYSTPVVQSIKTRKIPKVLVKYEATANHPAQTEVFNVDEIVGTWATKHFSTAIPAAEKTAMISRVDDLITAVKQAREAANSIEADNVEIANSLLNFVFATNVE